MAGIAYNDPRITSNKFYAICIEHITGYTDEPFVEHFEARLCQILSDLNMLPTPRKTFREYWCIDLNKMPHTP